MLAVQFVFDVLTWNKVEDEAKQNWYREPQRWQGLYYLFPLGGKNSEMCGQPREQFMKAAEGFYCLQPAAFQAESGL